MLERRAKVIMAWAVLFACIIAAFINLQQGNAAEVAWLMGFAVLIQNYFFNLKRDKKG